MQTTTPSTGSGPRFGPPASGRRTLYGPPWATPRPRPPYRSWTWQELTAVEPRLLELECEVQALPFTWRAYGVMKRRLFNLCGWGAPQQELRTTTAWDVARDHLEKAFLPEEEEGDE